MTEPLEAMTTTITTFGCSWSTSTRWILALEGGGAVARASRSVIWESAAVVSRIASSTSRRIRSRLRDEPLSAGSASPVVIS